MMPAEVPWFCNLIDGQLFRNHCIMDTFSGWLPLNTALHFWISSWNTIKPNLVWKKFGKTVNIYCLVWFFLVGTFQWISWTSLQNQFKSRRSIISEESSLLSFPFILTGTGPPEVKCMTWNLLFLFWRSQKGTGCIDHTFRAFLCPFWNLSSQSQCKNKTICTHFRKKILKKKVKWV